MGARKWTPEQKEAARQRAIAQRDDDRDVCDICTLRVPCGTKRCQLCIDAQVVPVGGLVFEDDVAWDGKSYPSRGMGRVDAPMGSNMKPWTEFFEWLNDPKAIGIPAFREDPFDRTERQSPRTFLDERMGWN